MKPKISVVMIVKNEEEMLSRCLESVKGADELIIVDTGSEDKTLEIAKKYTSNVYNDFVWCDDFAKARNHALAKATGDYILSIDADEFLHSFEEVKKAVDLAVEKKALAINCKLIHERGTVHYFPRLFKRCPEVWWEGAVHNHISTPAADIGNVEITYGYSPAHKKDPERAFRILKKEVERTNNPREVFYLGREYWYRSRFPECLQTLKGYVDRSKYISEKADAFLMMAKCSYFMDNWEDARYYCSQAIVCNAHFKEAIEFMATLAGRGSGQKDWERNAEQWLTMAKTADNGNVLFLSPDQQ